TDRHSLVVTCAAQRIRQCPLHEVQIGTMPGQEQQRAMLAGDRQRKPVQPGVIGIPPVITQAVHRCESVTKIGQLHSAQRRSALSYPQPNSTPCEPALRPRVATASSLTPD